MEHPCYTSINPAAEAHRYTSEKVQVRKVTFIYDWLDPDRDVKSWFRRVPYHLEKGVGHRSWIVRYFEFRAKVFPVPQMGFVGDLWICWDVTDPSIWFKVDETTWERWVGCASSVREVSFVSERTLAHGSLSTPVFFFGRLQQMDAKHPFLDKAYLWFDPIDYFFTDPKRSGGRVSLRWERSQRIRRVAPASRIVGPGCDTPPKKGPLQSVRLPTMRTIVGEMCPHMPQPVPKPRSVPMTPDVDRQRGSRHSLNIATSRVHVVDPCGPFPNEDIAIGSDVEIDWDWWGSSRSNSASAYYRFVVTKFIADDEARDEITQVGNSQPPHLSPTPTPPPVTPAERSRYHPCTSLHTTYTSTLPTRTFVQIHHRLQADSQDSNRHVDTHKALSTQQLRWAPRTTPPHPRHPFLAPRAPP